MKSFLEEYGFAILAAIVVILLIAMASPVGNLIRDSIKGVVVKFSNKTNSMLDTTLNQSAQDVAGAQTNN